MDLVTAKPSYLDTPTKVGLDVVLEVMTPPLLKIRQAQVRDERLKADFTPGDVVLMPEYRLLTNTEAETPPLRVTPIISYREWCCWNPYAASELPFIRDRSRDPKSDIARKAQAQLDSPDSVKDPCPELPSETLKYFEHLNYLVVIHEADGSLSMPVLLSFNSSEYKAGKRFANLIVAANSDMYAGVYDLVPEEHSNAKGSWFGFKIARAVDTPWVTEDQHSRLAAAYQELLPKIKEGHVQADYGGDTYEPADTVDAADDVEDSNAPGSL